MEAIAGTFRNCPMARLTIHCSSSHVTPSSGPPRRPGRLGSYPRWPSRSSTKMPENNRNVFGVLFEAPEHPIKRETLLVPGRVALRESVRGTCWEVFDYSSTEPLRSEDLLGQAPPYSYPLIARRSGRRVLAVSPVLAAVFRFHEILGRQLFPVTINVDSLVRSMVKRPSSYVLTRVYAKTPAFGTDLRSASYYGDNLGDAKFIRENIEMMNFIGCELRPITGGMDALNINSDGESFLFLPRRSPGIGC